MKIFVAINRVDEGTPDVTLRPATEKHPTGQLQIYPAGIGGVCFMTSPEDWTELVAAVAEAQK